MSTSVARTDRPDALRVDPVLRTTAGACLLGAGLLHAVVVAPHHADWAPAGIFFLVLELTQITLGLLLLLDDGRLHRPAARAAVALSLGVLALYAVSRTVGLPFGPDQVAGPVGVVDAVTGLFEVVTLVAASLALRSGVGPSHPRVRNDGPVIVSVVVVVATLGAFALFAGGPAERGPTADAQVRGAGVGGGRIVGAPPGTVAADQVATIAALSASFSGARNFEPAQVHLGAGATAVIQFVNEDDTDHNLSLYRPGSRGEAMFVGRTIGAGEAVDYPFTTPPAGAYILRCDLHPWMQGSLETS